MAERRVIEIDIDGRSAEISASKLEASLKRVERELDPLGTKLKKTESDIATLSGAFNAGAIGAERYASVMPRLKQRHDELSQSMRGTATTAQQLRPYMANLTAQFNDVAVSLFSGQKPLTVFIQQGAQIQGIMQQAGVGLMRFVNPLTIAAAGLVAIGAAFSVGISRAEALDHQLKVLGVTLAQTGNATGVTSAGAQARALDFARQPGVNRDTAQQAAQGILANPLISPDVFARALPLARDFAQVTGQDIPAAAKALATALTGGYKAAQDLDKQFQFLSVSELDQIRNLEEQGKKGDAARVMLGALEKQIKGLADQAVTPMAKATNDLGNAWDKMLDLFAKTGPIQAARKGLIDLLTIAGNLDKIVDAFAKVGAQDEVAARVAEMAKFAAEAQRVLAELERTRGANDFFTKQQQSTVDVAGGNLQGAMGSLFALAQDVPTDKLKQLNDEFARTAGAVSAAGQAAGQTKGQTNDLAQSYKTLSEALDPTRRQLEQIENQVKLATSAFFAGLLPIDEWILKLGVLSNMKIAVPTAAKLIADSAAEAREAGMGPAGKARASTLRTLPDQRPDLTPAEVKQIADNKARAAVAGGGFNLGERIGAIDAEVAATKKIVDAYGQSEEAGRRAELILKAITQQHKLGADAIAKYVAALEREDAAKRQIEAAKQLRQMQDEITGQERLTAALALSTVEYDKQKIAVEAAAKARQGYTPQQVAQFADLATRQLQDRYKQEAIALNRQLDPIAQYNDTIAKLDKLRETGVLSAKAQQAAYEEAYIKMGRAGDSWLGGAQAGLMEFARTSRNVGDAVAGALVQGLQAGTDALAKLMLGMKVDFKGLVADLRLSLARAFIGASLTGPLAGLLGGGLGAAGGGLGISGTTIMPGFAGGGGVGGGSIFGGGGGFGDILGGIRQAFGPNGMLGGLFGGGGGGSVGSVLGGAFGGGMNWMGGLGGLLGGAMSFASGNPLGGIAGLIGGGLSLIPGLGPIGGIIGALGGLLGGLLKKKPKTPQGVSNLMFTDGSWESSLAMTRGKGGGQFGSETGKLAGSLGSALDDIASAYGLSFLSGTPGGYIGHSQGKNTGSMYFGGIGQYGGARGVGFGAEELITGQSSPEAVVNAVAAAIIQRGARGGTISGLTGTQTTALTNADLASLDDVKKALDFSKLYDDTVRGAENITAAETAIKALNDQFRALRSQAQDYGLDVAIIDQRRQESINKLATDMNADSRRRLLGLTPEGQLQIALEDNDKALAEAIRNAQEINRNVTGTLVDINLLEQSYGQQRLKIIEGANQAANDSLEQLWRRLTYGDLSAASPQGTLQGTESAYRQALAAAQGGDATARGNLSQFAEDYVTAGYRYQGSNAAQAGLVSGVAGDIAPFFTANSNLNGAANLIAASVNTYSRLLAEQSATITRQDDRITLLLETIETLTRRVDLLLAA